MATLSKKAEKLLLRVAKHYGRFELLGPLAAPQVDELEAAGLIENRAPHLAGRGIKYRVTLAGYHAVGREPNRLAY